MWTSSPSTLANRSFIALFIASLLGAVATGLAAALAFYFYTYFWEFTSIQTGIITTGVFLAAVMGSVMAPYVSRKLGKKKGAIIIGLVAFLGAPMPILLRVLGLLPENGTAENIGAMDAARWQAFFTIMSENGVYPTGLDWRAAFTTRFIGGAQ